MKRTIFLFLALMQAAVSISIWSQVGDTIDGNSIALHEGNNSWRFGSEVLMNHNGTIIGIGDEEFNTNNDGRVTMFRLEDNVWTQLGDGIVGPNEGDEYGTTGRAAMNAAGNIVSIGGLKSGYRVSIYEWNGTDWNQRGDSIRSGYLCYYSALNDAGDIVAVASPYARIVDVFQWNSTSWVQMGDTVQSPLNNPYVFFGKSLSLNGAGDILAIGASNFNFSAGTVIMSLQFFIGHLRNTMSTVQSIWHQISIHCKL